MHSTVLSKGVSTAGVAKSRTRLSDWTTNGRCTLLQGLSDQCVVNRLVSNYWEHCDWERLWTRGPWTSQGAIAEAPKDWGAGLCRWRETPGIPREGAQSQAKPEAITRLNGRGGDPLETRTAAGSGALSLPMRTLEVPSESRRGVYLSVQVRPRPWAEYVSGCIRAFNRDPTFPTRPASHPTREQLHSLCAPPPSCRDRRGKPGPP